jgi:hypothetical protein
MCRLAYAWGWTKSLILLSEGAYPVKNVRRSDTTSSGTSRAA